MAFTVCGVIRAPLKDARLFVPWAIGELPIEAAGREPLHLAVACGLLAILFAGRSAVPAASPTGLQDVHDADTLAVSV